MKKTLFIFTLMLGLSLNAAADNWEYIRDSGEYYYGVGHDDDYDLASNQALENLIKSISVHVASDFQGLTDETNKNGNIDHETRIFHCVKTYSSSSLTNVKSLEIKGKDKKYNVVRYIERSELDHIFEGRIKKAKDYVVFGKQALERRNIYQALKCYYWAYSLIRSLQHPADVTDENGASLMVGIPFIIEDILSNIKVSYDKSDGDFVDLLFTYDGKPINDLAFKYNDSRQLCEGKVTDGLATMELATGNQLDIFHLHIDYECKEVAHGDDEMSSVLEVIPVKVFHQANKIVKKVEVPKELVAEKRKSVSAAAASQPMTLQDSVMAYNAEMKLTPTNTQVVDDNKRYQDVIDKVIAAVREKKYANIASPEYFTLNGLDVFEKLIAYGSARIIGVPDIYFFKSFNGNVVARGLKMSFSFAKGTKKTFVEDVVFTFDPDGKIDNVSFGLGQEATKELLCDKPGWPEDARELLTEFLENYKTAYSLRRLDYIKSIFADDAVIIVGNVAKRKSVQDAVENNISIEGQQIITYNKMTKSEYLVRLANTFRRNEFINLRFTSNEVQKMTKYKESELYAIQLEQEYNSSLYADKGFLFLLVDMTDKDEPQIKIRTWQPNEVDMENIYNAGNFYSN